MSALRWQRWWWSCVLLGGILWLGGGAVRAVSVYAVFRPFTLELDPELSAQERLQVYRIAARATPYVLAGGALACVGLCAIGIQERHRLRQRGWLFMVLVLAALALLVELWLLVGYDIPLLRAIVWGEPTVEALDALLLRRAQAAGAAASLATLAEWTIALLCVWRPLERAEHVRNALEGVGAGAT